MQDVSSELTKIVWWALPIGGALGGFARSLVPPPAIDFPYLKKYKTTGQWTLIPGVLGNIVLGVIVALVVAGSAAATFQWQGAWDARGFFGPLASSIIAGFASADYLQSRAKQLLNDAEKKLLNEAEKLV